jgi:arginyl-tRNA synthetase
VVEGPAHEALVEVVRDALRFASGAYPDEAEIEALPNPKVASFRVDLKPVFRHETGNLQEQCADLAAVLSRYDCVDRAVAIPPRVYIEPELGFFERVSVEHIIDNWLYYGRRNLANGAPLNVNFTSPNANKPLHIGHLRISFNGMAIANMFAAQGWDVERSEIISDYGVHICQALVGYLKWGNGETPGQAGVRGDLFVGGFYVKFHQENARLTPSGDGGDGPQTSLEQEAADLLGRMEQGDQGLLELNHRFVTWAIDGYRETYKRIDTWHSYTWLESEVMPIGRAAMHKLIDEGKASRRPDGSAYVDLQDKNLGVVTVLRSDDSPLVFIPLLSVWLRRFQLAPNHTQIHVGGDQWEAGISAVLELVAMAGAPEAKARTERCNVGMVRMPEGKVRSRTGEAMSADEVLDRIRDELVRRWAESTETHELDTWHRERCDELAIGLVKYHMLAAERTKELVYDENRLWNETLPRFARIVRLLAQDQEAWKARGGAERPVSPYEGEASGDERRAVCLQLNLFPMTLTRACAKRDTSYIVRYLDNLSTALATVPDDDVSLRRAGAVVLRQGLAVLNIKLPALLRELPPDFS